MATFDVTIEPPFAKQGQAVRILCNVRDEQSRVTFEWYRIGADGQHSSFGVNGVVDGNHYLGGRGLLVSIPTDDDVTDNVATWVLTIPAAEIEDTADWGCNTQYNADTVAHLKVITIPSGLLMYGSRDPITAADQERLTPFDQEHTITVHEQSSAYVMCVANGFSPQPQLSLTFNGQQLGNGNQECGQEMVVSEAGYAYNVFNCAITSAKALHMEPQADRLPLECSATVEGQDGEIEVVAGVIRPVIEVAPTLTCFGDAYAIKFEKNVNLSCVVESSPEPDSILMKWSTGPEQNEFDESLEAGEKSTNQDYTSRRERRADGIIDVHFDFPRVGLNQFRNYTIVATNRAGEATKVVGLIHDLSREPVTKGPGGHGNSKTPDFALISIGVVIVHHLWRTVC